MKPKTYPLEVVESIAKNLEELPSQTANFMNQEQALKKLKKQIKGLYVKKQYDAKQITQVLNKNGLKVTLKEVREILKINS